jgi:hypothetical protein
MDASIVVEKMRPFFSQEGLTFQDKTKFYQRCYEEFHRRVGCSPNASMANRLWDALHSLISRRCSFEITKNDFTSALTHCSRKHHPAAHHPIPPYILAEQRELLLMQAAREEPSREGSTVLSVTAPRPSNDDVLDDASTDANDSEISNGVSGE